MNINISLSEEEYRQLKSEASHQKKSLAAIIKEKVAPKKRKEIY